jgi:Lrp/AsnC family transcriptional regulator, leucine-responsive regulatory protein
MKRSQDKKPGICETTRHDHPAIGLGQPYPHTIEGHAQERHEKEIDVRADQRPIVFDQDEGYIRAYRAVLDRKRIGLGLTVFVGVKIEAHANDRAGEFQEAVAAMPETVSCHLVASDIDYLLEVVVPDLDHYQRYLVEKLLNLPIVREIRSNIVLEPVKAGASLPLSHPPAAGRNCSRTSFNVANPSHAAAPVAASGG